MCIVLRLYKMSTSFSGDSETNPLNGKIRINPPFATGNLNSITV